MIRLSTYIAHSASQGYALRFPNIGEGNYRPAYYANGTNFVHGGKGTFQNYNQDQKTAIRALPESADDNDYYLFFVDCYDRLDTAGMVSNEIVSGYMPVGRHYGFIYNEFNNPRTIAHELGHGVNALHHTFSAESETFHATNGTTDNLMDYNGGTTLNHQQWQWSHETHRNVLGFLDDEEESEGIFDVYLKPIPDLNDLSKIKRIDDKIKQKEGLVDKIKTIVAAGADEEAIDALIETAKYIDPNVSEYDEEIKQQIFKTDANKTVAILLYEFATGEGEETREFTDYLSEGSFANKFLEGRVIKEIEEDFYKEIEEKKYTYDDFKKSGIKTSLEFSPDQTETYLESIRKHLDSNLPQFFIGGATITYFSTENNEFVIVSMSNPTSRRSLMLHVADNYDRENGKIIPLSTIKQNIVFKLKIDPNRFYK